MNMGKKYEDYTERKNMSDCILGVVWEEESEIITTPKILSYIKEASKGTGQKNLVSTHPQHQCVEAQNKTTTRQMYHDLYHMNGGGTPR